MVRFPHTLLSGLIVVLTTFAFAVVALRRLLRRSTHYRRELSAHTVL